MCGGGGGYRKEAGTAGVWLDHSGEIKSSASEQEHTAWRQTEESAKEAELRPFNSARKQNY